MWRASILAVVIFAFLAQIRTVRVGMDLRMVETYIDQKGVHHVYYTEPGNGKEAVFLGEEIFKDGQKVFDNYKENDGQTN